MGLKWLFESYLHRGDSRNYEWRFSYLHGTCMCVKKEKDSNSTLGDMEEMKQVDISLELLERRKAQDSIRLGSQGRKWSQSPHWLRNIRGCRGHRRAVLRWLCMLLIMSFNDEHWELWPGVLIVRESRAPSLQDFCHWLILCFLGPRSETIKCVVFI